MRMAKTLLDRIDEEFIRELRNHKSNPAAYDAACNKLENELGFSVPYSYESFRIKKRRQKKRK